MKQYLVASFSIAREAEDWLNENAEHYTLESTSHSGVYSAVTYVLRLKKVYRTD